MYLINERAISPKTKKRGKIMNETRKNIEDIVASAPDLSTAGAFEKISALRDDVKAVCLAGGVDPSKLEFSINNEEDLAWIDLGYFPLRRPPLRCSANISLSSAKESAIIGKISIENLKKIYRHWLNEPLNPSDEA